MRYVEAKLEIEKRDEMYRFYLTDALKAVAENTARLVGGTVMNYRYKDISTPVMYGADNDGEQNEDDNSEEKAQEIISRLKRKLRGGK